MLSKFFSVSGEPRADRHDDKPDVNTIPRHVAVIMDGNGRWAKRRGLPRSAGHKAGADTLKKIVAAAGELGVKVLTVYAFSTENWKRPAEEVTYIMDLMYTYLQKNLLELGKNNVRLRFIGDRSRLSGPLQETFAEAEVNLAANTGLSLNVAVNYGGRKLPGPHGKSLLPWKQAGCVRTT